MRLKNYLSYSQYTTFMASEKQYIKNYFEGRTFHSKYLSFGKRFAEAVESGTDDKQFLEVIAKLPKAQKHERKFLVDFEGIPLLGFLDGFTKGKEFIIDEYKTGKVPWTQKKVDKHIQLLFYAIMVWKEYGIAPDKIRIRLHWIETCEDTDGTLFFTGKVKHFETRRTLKDIMIIYPKIKMVWIGIERLVDAYLAEKNI